MNLIKILSGNFTRLDKKVKIFATGGLETKMLRLTAVFAAGLALAGAVDVGGINMNTGVNTGKYRVQYKTQKKQDHQ